MAHPIQRSFTSGEIAPALRSRADLTKYQTGLALCENFIVRPQGGVYSRPGFRWVAEQRDSAQPGRLIEFSFNTEQTYVLLFEHLTMRVIADGGYVESGGSPVEIATPYSTADLDRLQVAQSADVLTIVHPSHAPRNLSRASHTSWSLDVVSYAPTVPAPAMAAAATVAISGIAFVDAGSIFGGGPTGVSQYMDVTTGAVHGLTAGDSFWIEDVVGNDALDALVNDQAFKVYTTPSTTILRARVTTTIADHTYTSGGSVNYTGAATTVGAGAGTYSKTYRYVVTAVSAGVESLASTEVKITTPSLSATAGVKLTWNDQADVDVFRIYKDPGDNANVYGWVGDANGTEFTDFNIAPLTSETPPTDRRPFDDVGNPGAVGYYQQRQVFANLEQEPQSLYTTQTGNYSSFRVSSPTRDDDAVTLTIAAQQVNEIRHIVPVQGLLLLTSGAVWKVTEGDAEVLTPSTVGVRPQSYRGASTVPPALVGDSVVYLQDKGARLRDIAYEFASDTYRGNDLSIMSEHLFSGRIITSMAYAEEPYGVLWCVRSDGVLLGMTYQKEHQVWGWHQHTTEGAFEDVAVISEDGRDALYAIVRRTIGGATKRFVERLEPRVTATVAGAVADAFCVDSGLSYSGAAATTISGLDHLEGEEVAVLADGNEVTGLTVVSGAIELPQAAGTVHAGLAFVPALETLDLDAQGAETIKADPVSVSRVTIEVEASRGGWVGPKTEDGGVGEMREIKPRFETDGYGSIQLRDYKEEVIVEPQWSRGGGLRLEQRAPVPIAILSIIPRVDVSG